jgi:hypothetical protein
MCVSGSPDRRLHRDVSRFQAGGRLPRSPARRHLSTSNRSRGWHRTTCGIRKPPLTAGPACLTLSCTLTARFAGDRSFTCAPKAERTSIGASVTARSPYQHDTRALRHPQSFGRHDTIRSSGRSNPTRSWQPRILSGYHRPEGRRPRIGHISNIDVIAPVVSGWPSRCTVTVPRQVPFRNELSDGVVDRGVTLHGAIRSLVLDSSSEYAGPRSPTSRRGA